MMGKVEIEIKATVRATVDYVNYITVGVQSVNGESSGITLGIVEVDKKTSITLSGEDFIALVTSVASLEIEG